LFQLLKDALLASGTPEYPSRYFSVLSISYFLSTVKFNNINYNLYREAFGTQHLHATLVHHDTTLEDPELAWYLSKEELKAMGSNNTELMRTFKSAPQGAATQDFAAVSKEWANKSGRCLSNCVEQVSTDERVKEGCAFLFSDYGYMP
ncbi:hypothetical protein DE146DRAFT_615816, partial [Phaeosphaeria sp. MPI-PUGE-AT-0046c]